MPRHFPGPGYRSAKKVSRAVKIIPQKRKKHIGYIAKHLILCSLHGTRLEDVLKNACLTANARQIGSELFQTKSLFHRLGQTKHREKLSISQLASISVKRHVFDVATCCKVAGSGAQWFASPQKTGPGSVPFSGEVHGHGARLAHVQRIVERLLPWHDTQIVDAARNMHQFIRLR